MSLRSFRLILLTSAVCGALLAAPVVASADTDASNPGAANASQPAAPSNVTPSAAPKLICKSDDGEETGSHVPHRTCLTQAQWDNLNDDPGAQNVTQVPVIGQGRAGGFGSAAH